MCFRSHANLFHRGLKAPAAFAILTGPAAGKMLSSMQGFRRAIVHLALIALILRGFLPAGWMPNPVDPGQSAFVICTMDGPVTATDGKTLPGKDDPRAHETCPFAHAAQPAQSGDFIAVAAPELSSTAAPRLLDRGLEARRASFFQPASRAPPSFS